MKREKIIVSELSYISIETNSNFVEKNLKNFGFEYDKNQNTFINEMSQIKIIENKTQSNDKGTDLSHS